MLNKTPKNEGECCASVDLYRIKGLPSDPTMSLTWLKSLSVSTVELIVSAYFELVPPAPTGTSLRRSALLTATRDGGVLTLFALSPPCACAAAINARLRAPAAPRLTGVGEEGELSSSSKSEVERGGGRWSLYSCAIVRVVRRRGGGNLLQV